MWVLYYSGKKHLFCRTSVTHGTCSLLQLCQRRCVSRLLDPTARKLLLNPNELLSIIQYKNHARCIPWIILTNVTVSDITGQMSYCILFLVDHRKKILNDRIKRLHRYAWYLENWSDASVRTEIILALEARKVAHVAAFSE